MKARVCNNAHSRPNVEALALCQCLSSYSTQIIPCQKRFIRAILRHFPFKNDRYLYYICRSRAAVNPHFTLHLSSYKGGQFPLLSCGISVLPFLNISTSCTEIRIKPKDIPTGTSGPKAEYQVIYELQLRRLSCRSSNIFDFIRPPELGQE
jgi:hypothetical protein